MKLRLLPRGNASEQRLITAPQFFDPEAFRTMGGVLGPGSVFVDVGANAGAYAFRAARRVGAAGRVLALEPDPEMCRRLRFNIATNALSGIKVAAVAASDRAGRAELNVNPGQRGTNSLNPGASGAPAGRLPRVVETIPLLDLLDLFAIPRMDVLKLDIDGHEPAVLRHFLAHAPDVRLPALIIAAFKRDTARPILVLLAGRGYRLQATTKLSFILGRPAAGCAP